ncbi:MAG TPA: SDR family NAD(P)-dependent oxidoreductase [Sphingobium sp.]|uniref:SDR family NAD(P)-dependent oxidoreductase n=1 Tax=Sphingobium sp. TaxID=1912891 RepID=UPI002ED1A82B
MKKVALVTGAAAGIGAAIARRLAREGIAIGVLDILIDDARKIADEIVADGGQAIALQASIADRTQVNVAVQQLRDAFGPVNILVNNAGITGFIPFEQITDEQWDRMMEINLKGTFIVTQVCLQDMKDGEWGRIVNISSSSAQTGAINMAHYSASKGGMVALTRTLAQELGGYGITCNTIPPRFVMGTVMSEKTFAETSIGGGVTRQAMAQSGPVRREGRPEDIASAAAWLCQDDASYVTGQVIGVNGGRFIG